MAIEKRIGAYSAYAIAVKHGFVGTEEEWLESLIGPRGYQGWGVSAVSVSADGSLIFTIKNPETGETRELEPIQIETLNALNSISTAKDEAISEVKKSQTQATEAVGTAKTQAVQAVEDAENTGVSAVEDAKSNALKEVGKAKTTAVDAVNAAGTQAASDAQTAITTAKNQAVSDVQAAGQSAVNAVEDTKTAGLQAVEDAQTNAVQSVQDTGAAEVEKINDILPVPTEADNGKILTVIDGIWAARDPGYPAETWADIQKIVRLGAAPRYFPVGYEFVTHDSAEDTDIIWRVVGYDTIKAADESLTHTMILETKYAYSKASGAAISIQFGQLQALYHCQNQLEAGTYNFTLMNADIAVGGGKTYTFTLSNPVPAGGVLTFPWTFGINAETVKIISFASNLADEPIETVSVSVGSDGTSLGLVDGTVEGLNYQDRFRYGSNNYAQSAIRQWLNSSESAGNVWIPKTKFDRPPIYKNSISGFMSGLPEDFLSVVKPASVTCYTNKIYEVDGLDGSEYGIMEAYALTDMFFPLSRTEIYGPFFNQSVSGADGEQLEFYKNLTDAERIKYDVSEVAKTVWTRSNTEFTGYSVYDISPTGTISNGTAGASTYGVCPACIIA